MKRDHTGMIKGFTWLSRAYYGQRWLKDNKEIDNVTFGFYAPEGGTTGEMSVSWIIVGGKVTPQWTIFSDAWSALANFHDLIDFLGEHDSEAPSPQQFCEYLLQCGFIDRTPTERPY